LLFAVAEVIEVDHAVSISGLYLRFSAFASGKPTFY